MSIRSKIILAIGLIFVPITLGVGGYMVIENASFLDALFMTVTTIATVGYGEVFPLSPAGRIFTIFLIISNIGIFAYALSLVSRYLFEGQFFEQLKANRMKAKIANLENHVIVCGFGRNGHSACEMLQKNGIPFVIIENKAELLDQYLPENEQVYYLNEDATKDETLIHAGIYKARGLITTLPTDADNVYVVLTARELNSKVLIISRASSQSSLSKLKRAGANNIIMPDKIGGAHMASLVIMPDVKEFIDILGGQGGADVIVEEFGMPALWKGFQGSNIREMAIRHRTGANIIGRKSAEGDYEVNPDIEHNLTADDKLIILATSSQMKLLKDKIGL